MISLDEEIASIAERHGLFYTRYADDIALSTRDCSFTRRSAAKVIGRVYGAMGRHGLSPNRTKTRVAPPGARKIVLGLLVDGDRPRLTREFRSTLRQHIHFLRHRHIGPVLHAQRRGFASVLGLQNHISGLIAYARHIDSDFADQCAKDIRSVWDY